MTQASKIPPAASRWPLEVNFPVRLVEQIVARHGINAWYAYIHKERATRWDVWQACFFLAERLAPEAAILETGCGCGFNSLWFGQRGYKHLAGFDLDPAVVAAARDLAVAAGIGVDYWVDDGLAPAQLGARTFDAITALNWTMYAPALDLGDLLRRYRRYLRPGGYLLLDAIDRSYDGMPNNQYLTSDWSKPVENRRPSEYLRRLAEAEVRGAATAAGLPIVATITQEQAVPRIVYAMQAAS